MTNPTPADVERLIAEAEAALEGVTQGPWLFDGSLCMFGGLPPNGALHQHKCTVAHFPATDMVTGLMTKAERDANARFIAHARQAVPALIAALRALHAERDEYAKSWGEACSDAMKADERAEAAEATVATLTAQVEAMRGALDEIDTKANNGAMTSTYSEGTLRSILKRIRDRARAALTTENHTNG